MFIQLCVWDIQIKFISGNNSYTDKDLQFRFFCIVKGAAKISLEPTWSLLPSAQNSPYTKVTHCGEVCS